MLPSCAVSELSLYISDLCLLVQRCQGHNGCFDATWPKRSWRCGYVRLACRFPREDRVRKEMEASETATAFFSVEGLRPLALLLL
jgi:hypothetical protein